MTRAACAAVGSVLDTLPPIGLAELRSTADLQTRLDRKYILAPEVLVAAVRALAPTLRVLTIDGLREFAYDSVYFDTPALDSYHGAATGRRRRFKVRTRSYLDSGECVLEVKTAGGRGHTVKERLPWLLDRRDALDDAGREFLHRHRIDPDVSHRLTPTLVTRYRRSTLLGDDGARFTVDTGLRCVTPSGASVDLGRKVLVETKSPGAVTGMDRFLWACGLRPVTVSKYATGLAALTPGLAANKWNTTLRRHFCWAPATPERV
ncbi:polyphosphate polymerase domain-containing protein [Nakamurella deserti]|uniref:polyphosphate polymerase domain-containing protein n=1 Tax=Nakamurella deserti TaxID=2164074 RepID=UPI000DBE90B7|nr:polyphosphate polymerase domain-containing protein [Nakamurella deserti]